MPHDVFISYSSKNEAIAEQLCAVIEQSELVCWMAPRNLRPGSKFAREIVEAIQNCSVMLLIFSDASNQSEHVENEITIAFNEGKTIIPFKITDTEMSLDLKYYLNKKHWIDGTPEPEKCFDKLVNQISLSVPRKSKEIKEEEIFKNLDLYLENFSKNGSDQSNIQLQSLQQKIADVFRVQKQAVTKETKKAKVTRQAENNQSEGRYDIIQNGAGELLIIIRSRAGIPDNPRLVYDGGPRALLYRSRESSVMLGDIDMEARVALRAADEVIIVETEDDEVIREYTVPVRNVRSLDALLEIAKKEIAEKETGKKL